MARARVVVKAATVSELLQVDLCDRPFLSEQGQAVTRGFVEHLEVEDGHWQLQLRDVEILDKDALAWRHDVPRDCYGGSLAHSSFRRHWGGRQPIFDVGMEISCYGIFLFIGRRAERPWAENDWPELDTDFLAPGPME